MGDCGRECSLLLQLRVLCLSLLKDGDFKVGVFPECEEILIRGAALGNVALERVSASHLEMGQRADGFVEHNPAMVEDFLKLGRGFASLPGGEIRLSSHVYGVKVGPVVIVKRRQPQFIGRSGPKNDKRLLGICM